MTENDEALCKRLERRQEFSHAQGEQPYLVPDFDCVQAARRIRELNAESEAGTMMDYTAGEVKGSIAQWASDLANVLLDQIEMFETKGMPFEEKLPLAVFSFTLDGKAVDFVVGFEENNGER